MNDELDEFYLVNKMGEDCEVIVKNRQVGGDTFIYEVLENNLNRN